jgi:LL-diaminopimelate aminotransferase
VLIVNDNPYSEISFDGVEIPSILQVDGAKDVAVEFNSLSKTYNMTGWRIGMAVGNPAALDAIAQVKENTDTGLFTAVQHAGVAALEGPKMFIAENNAVYQRRRDLVVPALRRIGFDVALPKSTIFAWVKLPDGAKSAAFASRLLDLCGVVVTPGTGFGSYGEGFIRISLGIPDETLNEAMQRIESVADRLLDHKDA